MADKTGSKRTSGADAPSVTEGFGEFFSGVQGSEGGSDVAAGPGAAGGPGVSGAGSRVPSGGRGFDTTGGRFGQGGSGGSAAAPGAVASTSPNLGLQRRTGRKRVVGGATSIRSAGSVVQKSYSSAGGLQFNDVEELRGDAISRAFAQEILERLWIRWGLDLSSPEVMKKAEDLVHALVAMRTASPDADYNVLALIGAKEVNLQDLSNILQEEEVTRRRFARAIADDVRAYIADPDNVRLREMLTVELGVKAEYATLAFDGSTHCSGMSTNQVMFTKQLERMNLFDTAEVRDRLDSGQKLSTGQFQVNRGRGAFT